MDISNIKEGQVFKNYPEICVALGEEEKSSNSKDAQLKNWMLFFGFQRKGHKFIIDKIYMNAKPKIDMRHRNGRRKIWREHIVIQILHYLAEESIRGRKEIFVRSKNLYYKLGLINDDYKKLDLTIDENIEKFIEDHPNQFGTFDLAKFIKYSGRKNRDVVRSALNALKDQSIIDFFDWYEIRHGFGKTRLATQNEMDDIRVIKYEIFNSGIFPDYVKSEVQVNKYGHSKKFYDIFNNRIKLLLKCDGAYRGYRIRFNAGKLPDQIAKYIKDAGEIEEERHNLNMKIHHNIIETAKKEYLEAEEAHRIWQEEIEKRKSEIWGVPNPVFLRNMPNMPKEPVRYNEWYPKNVKKIADLLVLLAENYG